MTNKKRNNKGIKIVAAIVVGLFALLLITQLWWLYIIIGTIVLAVRVDKIKTESDKSPQSTAAINKPSYWGAHRSTKALVALTIICPPAGLVVISQHRRTWIKRGGIALSVTSWTMVWFLLLGYATHLPSGYTHPPYKSDISTVNLDDYSKQAQNASVAIPSKPSEARKTTDNTSTQKTTTSKGQPLSNQTRQSGNIMSGITMANPENEPYDRSSYQPNWSAGGGCDIRSRILSSTSLIAVSYGSNGCTVKKGSWKDPYTGKVLSGNPYQGDGAANDLDIDHIIPLNYVNSHGGYHWSSAQKRAYGDSLTAMSNRVYLAVSSSQNRSKGDNGPSVYYPPNSSFRCTYSKDWRNTARTYNISLSPADYKLIASVLVSCGVN